MIEDPEIYAGYEEVVCKECGWDFLWSEIIENKGLCLYCDTPYLDLTKFQRKGKPVMWDPGMGYDDE